MTQRLRIIALLSSFVVPHGFAECSDDQSTRSGNVETIEKLVLVYSNFLDKMHKIRFDYTGTGARSIPSRGTVGIWEHTGNICIDTDLNSVHLQSSISLREREDQPAGRDTIINESLLAPGICLSLATDTSRLAALNAESWSVKSKSSLPEVSWVDFLRDEGKFACLFGIQTVGNERGTFLDLLKTGHRSLSTLNTDDGLLLFVRIEGVDTYLDLTFRPDELTGEPSLESIEESCRTAEMIEAKPVSGLTKVRVEISEKSVTEMDGFQAKVTLKRKGGIIAHSKLENAVHKTARTLEPTTWTYHFLLTEMSNKDLEGCFVLKNKIPDGTSVDVED